MTDDHWEDRLSPERQEELRTAGLLPPTPRQKKQILISSAVVIVCQVTNLVLITIGANATPTGSSMLLVLDAVTMLAIILLLLWQRRSRQ